jgi:CBS-domain-containing membrane protein
MRLQDVMTRSVRTIPPATAAEDAWNLMQIHGIHHLVVADRSGVLGVVSARDVGARQRAALRAGYTAADLMTAPVVTVAPTTTVRKAANVMRGRSIGSLVVLDGERPVGIVTVSDLLELLGRGGDRGADIPRRRGSSDRVPHRKAAVPRGVW